MGKHPRNSTQNIRAAFFLNIVFTVLEILGGFWTNSLAILSDAVHDLGDSVSLGLAWYLDKLSKRKRDRRFSYGYRRFSLLGALINTIILIAGSLFILSEAVPRLIHPEHSNARGMILFAIIGIVVNGYAALRVKSGRSLNEQVVVWHLFEDVLGWTAVLVMSITLLFSDIHILDPILSILITIYVLFNVIRNLRKTLALFLQAVPDRLEIDLLEEKICAVKNVRSVHHTHIWSLDGEHHVLTTHVVVNQNESSKEVIRIKDEIRKLVKNLHISHTTVEIEFGDDDCVMSALPF